MLTVTQPSHYYPSLHSKLRVFLNLNISFIQTLDWKAFNLWKLQKPLFCVCICTYIIISNIYYKIYNKILHLFYLKCIVITLYILVTKIYILIYTYINIYNTAEAIFLYYGKMLQRTLKSCYTTICHGLQFLYWSLIIYIVHEILHLFKNFIRFCKPNICMSVCCNQM